MTIPSQTPNQTRRSALREALIIIAERRIAADGLAALRARDLATEAGCALGAIYTVFPDLTALTLEVNARTFTDLGQDVAEALAGAPLDPTAQMITMGHAYHRFAATNRNRWRALFDVARPAGTKAPDWYLADMARLFAYIADPVAVLFPQMPAKDRALFTRALFSSVHGIVFLALDEASAGVPEAETDRMIALLLERVSGQQTVS
jgi:AcrR family transcriptional regulator